MERIISEYKQQNRAGCDLKAIESFIKEMISNWKTNGKLYDCHVLPQWDFVTNQNGELWPGIRLLAMPNLQGDISCVFPSALGTPLKPDNVADDREAGKCDVKQLKDPEVIELVKETYAQDFELWEKYGAQAQ